MLINGIEEIYKPNYFIANETVSHVIRITAEMKEPVNARALQKAADAALCRYSYFKVKAEVEGGEYINAANDLPFEVTEGIRRIRLLSAENHYYPLAIQYEDRTIALDISHMLTDGHGLIPFLKTLLLYYAEFLTGKTLASPGINRVETPLFEDELGAPDRKIDYDSITAPLSKKKDVEDIFRLEELGLKNAGRKTVSHLKVDETAFMKYTKSVDGSPSVIMSALLARILWQLSGTEKPMSMNIAVDHRPMLENEHSYRQLSNTIPVFYWQKQSSWPIDRLCTAGRGSVMLQTDAQNILYYRKLAMLGMEKMNQIPSIEKKRELIRNLSAQTIGRFTSGVSYPGRIDLGGAAEYTERLSVLVDSVPDNGLLVEILAFKGSFYITFMQGFDDETIVREFMALLDSERIPYSYLGTEALRLSTVEPEEQNGNGHSA